MEEMSNVSRVYLQAGEHTCMKAAAQYSNSNTNTLCTDKETLREATMLLYVVLITEND